MQQVLVSLFTPVEQHVSSEVSFFFFFLIFFRLLEVAINFLMCKSKNFISRPHSMPLSLMSMPWSLVSPLLSYFSLPPSLWSIPY